MSAPDARRFDELAASYDQRVPFFATMGKRLVEWVDPRPGQRVLDLGAGRGAVSTAVSRRLGAAYELVAGDVSTEMLKHLRALSLPGARVCYCDATAIDEPDGSFDVILSAFVFHFLAARAQAVAEAARVLHRNGTFALSVPGPGHRQGWWVCYGSIIDEFCDRVGLPPSEATPPGLWERLAKGAGLEIVDRSIVEVVLPLADAEEHWWWLSSHSHRGLLGVLDERGRRDLHDRVIGSLIEHHPASGRTLIADAEFLRLRKA